MDRTMVRLGPGPAFGWYGASYPPPPPPPWWPPRGGAYCPDDDTEPFPSALDERGAVDPVFSLPSWGWCPLLGPPGPGLGSLPMSETESPNWSPDRPGRGCRCPPPSSSGRPRSLDSRSLSLSRSLSRLLDSFFFRFFFLSLCRRLRRSRLSSDLESPSLPSCSSISSRTRRISSRQHSGQCPMRIFHPPNTFFFLSLMLG
mmetsp:Transcript_4830/g.10817  ORF Transcript_4830/g.10817 Transcript_4830/m.10817 type:complete len:201 (-) Transcript_4830:300-902(-)